MEFLKTTLPSLDFWIWLCFAILAFCGFLIKFSYGKSHEVGTLNATISEKDKQLERIRSERDAIKDKQDKTIKDIQDDSNQKIEELTQKNKILKENASHVVIPDPINNSW